MLKWATRDQATLFELPGRSWWLLMGPEMSGGANMTFGLAHFPAGSAPPGHTHDSQEEIIYVMAGNGELVTSEGTVSLRPGTTVFIPIGLHHATASQGPEALQLISVFSPPVVPGSYESNNT